MEGKINILGISFSNITKRDAEEKILNSKATKECITIFTPNPEIAVKAQSDENIKKMINSAALVLPDGIGIVIASKFLSTPVKERICGIDMGEFIIDYANKNSLKLYLLGGKKGVSERAASEIASRYPKLKICGTHHGYFDKHGEENQSILQELQSLQPDIIFVCLGFPEQEKWIKENIPLLPSIKIAAALGGSLDIWSGDIKRAPDFMRKIGLEWMWRILKSPKRIKRIFAIPIFLASVAKQKYQTKKEHRKTDIKI